MTKSQEPRHHRLRTRVEKDKTKYTRKTKHKTDMPLRIEEHLEDWDNQELNPNDWKEQMWNAVLDYNIEHTTKYDPNVAIKDYLRYKKSKYRGDI